MKHLLAGYKKGFEDVLGLSGRIKTEQVGGFSAWPKAEV